MKVVMMRSTVKLRVHGRGEHIVPPECTWELHRAVQRSLNSYNSEGDDVQPGLLYPDRRVTMALTHTHYLHVCAVTLTLPVQHTCTWDRLKHMHPKGGLDTQEIYLHLLSLACSDVALTPTPYLSVWEKPVGFVLS